MSKLIGVSGSDLEEIRLDEPTVLSLVEVPVAIIGGKNIWKRHDNRVDTLVHWGFLINRQG